MGGTYTLDFQPQAPSPLGRYLRTSTDQPAVVLQLKKRPAIDPVLLTHQRLNSALDRLDDEEEEGKIREKVRMPQKRGVSLGRVKDLQLEAGIDILAQKDEEDEIEGATSSNEQQNVSYGVGAAWSDAKDKDYEAVTEGSKRPQYANALTMGAPFAPSQPSPTILGYALEDDDDVATAADLRSRGTKRTLSTCALNDRDRKWPKRSRDVGITSSAADENDSGTASGRKG